MRQFQTAFGLTLERIQHRTILDHQIGKKFQRDVALQFFVARQPYNPHSTSTEHLDEGVASENNLSTRCIPRRFENTTWAASRGRVGRNFGSAILANSDQRGHFGSRSRAPLV